MGVEDCSQYLPTNPRFTHDKKVELHKQEPIGHPNKDFYESLAMPLNQLAKQLQLADVDFLFALSSWESGWLNVENKALNNPFGMTAGGGDNLEFSSIQNACNYWACKFGPSVKGAKTLEAFIQGLKKSGYNANPHYFNMKKWQSQFHSVEKHRSDFGYEKVKDGELMIVRPKPR
jgi:hypothetical protein